MRRARGQGLQGPADRRGDRVVADLPGCARPRRVVEAVEPIPGEALTPLAGGVLVDPSRSAIAVLVSPAAASSTIRALSATAWLVPCRRSNASSPPPSVALRSIATALPRAIPHLR